MTFSSRDIVPLTKARAKLTQLCDEVHEGRSEKIITKNGEGYAALISSDLLDHYHRLEREEIHLTLLEEAVTGLKDFRSVKTLTLAQMEKRHGR